MFYKSRVKGQINERWRQTYLEKNLDHDPDQPNPLMRLADRNGVIAQDLRGGNAGGEGCRRSGKGYYGCTARTGAGW